MAKTNPWDGKWKVIKALPGGGQCLNYTVNSTNVSDTSLYVLKVIKDNSKHERRSRFYREVHHYISLNAPYFPQIVDHNCVNISDGKDRLYFVYQYIEGENLEEYINRNGKILLPDAIRLISLIIEAVAYSHANDIVHRDIKPDNIMLRECKIGTPVLIDSGLSANDADE